jgi:hypothetical protein
MLQLFLVLAMVLRMDQVLIVINLATYQGFTRQVCGKSAFILSVVDLTHKRYHVASMSAGSVNNMVFYLLPMWSPPWTGATHRQ